MLNKREKELYKQDKKVIYSFHAPEVGCIGATRSGQKELWPVREPPSMLLDEPTVLNKAANGTM
ncbi:hypothetical protein [Rickettsiales endosymbiont of Peranema trichophorum]|uniref:hypothetical protein n=1 Tax=Rickettsiales endosymbiont of Peranema trichophorum TaxID=2486577 RepID=UPI001023B615|nr:hypothetical protein [Rickettsiales endosymbiont of Peranema trichophorum]